ncbi:hypothetical protein I350_04586 [Cryptococcus amylolentus CBS 6273]|uniref:Histone-lysine N-methyltransferase, H3 lysine-36 specific n=1 Tax=Cryptococcus amylolentus CBS 6273 TaxID=1296118 RepID=A0A1E3JXH6_9TREE|nr:hypothetical protein I350_04586 [Cryptococcus amylolentus CBS 6273]
MGDSPDTKPELQDSWEGDKDRKPITPSSPVAIAEAEGSTSPSSKRDAPPSPLFPPASPIIDDEDLKPRTHTAPSTAPSSSRGGTKGGKKSATPEVKPVLIDDLPSAWDEAHETFSTLEKCVYERKDIGLTKENNEMMVCDCTWSKYDPDAELCGADSNCINRALFIECLAGECKAGRHCQNQQFSKKEYGDVEIVQTEKKGFGLRAGKDIPSNTLIYEYIGEVVKENTFRKRMQQYVKEGIRHFYFMMLQKEEYIDATKKGGIGRFANHSCNPNCEVQKWVVGRRLRMGIFSKRDVLRGEEITFNYNVDRYGHDAQTCYCGEPNCVGTIGGKTQTDIGTMNDLFLDALGITDEVEADGMKGSKKKKARQLDDDDFNPVLRPIVEDQVQKVAAAMRQSMENPKMMKKLLHRIKITEDPAIHRQLMRMHGFSMMFMVLTEMADDKEAVLLTLESMDQWKLQIRNKIEDSQIEEPVKELSERPNEKISSLAQKLLDYWSTLELSYKIPRVSKLATLDADDEAGTQTIAEANILSALAPRRPDAWENTVEIQLDIAPVRPRAPVPRSNPPPPPSVQKKPVLQGGLSQDRLKLDAIIAMAGQSVSPVPVEQVGESAGASPAAGPSRSANGDDERRKRQKRSHETEEEKQEKRERRYRKMVGHVVVDSMTKYRSQIDHDTFKKYAQECTDILVKKEKKRGNLTDRHLRPFADDKKQKLKAFTKDFTHKVIQHYKAKNKRRPSSSSLKSNGPSSSAAGTPSKDSTPGGSSLGQTPSKGGADNELMDDIFGADEEDVAMDLDDDDDGTGTAAGAPSTVGASATPASPMRPPTPPLPPPPIVQVVGEDAPDGEPFKVGLDLGAAGKTNGKHAREE